MFHSVFHALGRTRTEEGSLHTRKSSLFFNQLMAALEGKDKKFLGWGFLKINKFGNSLNTKKGEIITHWMVFHFEPALST